MRGQNYITERSPNTWAEHGGECLCCCSVSTSFVCFTEVAPERWNHTKQLTATTILIKKKSDRDYYLNGKRPLSLSLSLSLSK